MGLVNPVTRFTLSFSGQIRRPDTYLRVLGSAPLVTVNLDQDGKIWGSSPVIVHFSCTNSGKIGFVRLLLLFSISNSDP